MDTRITSVWNKRREMYAEGNKLYAEGSKLRAEGDKLYAEGSKLYAEGNKLYAEGNKLYAEGSKLRAEGDIELLTAIIAVYGNIKINDRFYDGTTPWILVDDVVIGGI